MLTEEIVNYFMWMAPLIFGHVVVPPLMYFSGVDDPPEFLNLLYEVAWPPELLSSKTFVESMCIPFGNSPKEPRQYFTHLFVHGSYGHLFSNLNALMYSGLPVYQEFGQLGLYLVFFGGGLCSALPTYFSNKQTESVKKEIANVLTDAASKYLPHFAQNAWSRLSQQIGIWGGAIITPSLACGSSGAVCALMGVRLPLICRDIVFAISDVLPADQSVIKNGTITTSRRRWRKWFDEVATKIRYTLTKVFKDPNNMLKVIQTFTMVNYLAKELSNVYSSDSWKLSRIIPSLDRALDMAQIGHSAHIQGMIFGIGFGTIFGVVLPWTRRHIRKYM